MFNKVILVGNLTRDIELRYTQSGSGIANTAIATSRKFTQNGEKKDEVCFVDITFFGRSSEIANQYLRKGSKILVEGRLKFDQWVDQNGQKRSKHSVIVETMQMLDSKGDTSNAPQRDKTTEGSGFNGNTHQNNNNGYNAPQQQQYDQRNDTYQQVPQQQQQNSHPHPDYQKQNQQANQTQAHKQASNMPTSDNIPEIDIDEDEIPFKGGQQSN